MAASLAQALLGVRLDQEGEGEDKVEASDIKTEQDAADENGAD
jgi:hypothetical protein